MKDLSDLRRRLFQLERERVELNAEAELNQGGSVTGLKKICEDLAETKMAADSHILKCHLTTSIS